MGACGSSVRRRHAQSLRAHPTNARAPHGAAKPGLARGAPPLPDEERGPAPASPTTPSPLASDEGDDDGLDEPAHMSRERPVARVPHRGFAAPCPQAGALPAARLWHVGRHVLHALDVTLHIVAASELFRCGAIVEACVASVLICSQLTLAYALILRYVIRMHGAAPRCCEMTSGEVHMCRARLVTAGAPDRPYGWRLLSACLLCGPLGALGADVLGLLHALDDGHAGGAWGRTRAVSGPWAELDEVLTAFAPARMSATALVESAPMTPVLLCALLRREPLPLSPWLLAASLWLSAHSVCAHLLLRAARRPSAARGLLRRGAQLLVMGRQVPRAAIEAGAVRRLVLTTAPEGVELDELCALLRASSAVVVVELGGVTLEPSGAWPPGLGPLHARILAAMTVGHASPWLRTSEGALEPAAVDAIVDAASAVPSLRVLHLVANQLSERGAAAALRGVARAPGAPALSHLVLAGNGLRDWALAGSDALLARMSSTLLVLGLQHNRLTDASVVPLCGALQACGALRTLWLNSNRIGDAGCDALAALVRVHARLGALNLLHNRFSIGAAARLTRACAAKGAQLARVCGKVVGGTSAASHYTQLLGDADAQLVAHDLAAEPVALTYLWLNDNRISDSGCAALAAVLKFAPSLLQLRLDGNDIGDDGAGALADALAAGSRVQELVLDGNRITHEGAQELAEALQTNGNLRVLSLRCGRCAPHSPPALAERFAACEAPPRAATALPCCLLLRPASFL